MEFIIKSDLGTTLTFTDDRKGCVCLEITEENGDYVRSMLLSKEDIKRLAKAL